MSTPKYQRLVNDLERAIDEGRFEPGAKLPSVRELMGLHQLSLTTVTTALGILEERDLVEPRARSGYFVKRREGTAVPQGPHLETGSGFHWWPDPELFPRERLRKLTATMVRRYPDLAIETPRNNNPRLQRELAKRCAETGCFVYPDDITVTHGLTEALSLALRAASRPGDPVLVQSPTTPLYQAIAEGLGLRVVPLDWRGPESAWLSSLETVLSDSAGPRTLLLAGNFQCPTGNSFSLSAKQTVLELARRHDAALIEDDSCGDLHFDKARPLPIKAYDREGKVLYIGSATRAIAPGLQLGWIVTGSHWRERIQAIKSIASSAVDNLPQLVLAEFLAQGGHLPHLRRLRKALEERAAEFETLLQPVIGAVLGLGERSGGFNRFLWLAGTDFDDGLEAECTKRWPNLFTGERPPLRFKSGGVSVNLSYPVDGARRDELCEFARRLAEHSEVTAHDSVTGTDRASA